MLIDGVIAFDAGELRGLAMPGHRNNPCDFCHVGTPMWVYPARDVAMGTVVVPGLQTIVPVARGNWLACMECADLVEVGDWPALARRSLRESGLSEAVRGGPPGLRVRLLAILSQAHGRFREARTGEPREEIAPVEAA